MIEKQTCPTPPTTLVSCFVCGTDVHDGWFARMNSDHQTVFLCSSVCARMFFEVKQPPAHDHRARHNFQRARAAILEAARGAMREASTISGLNLEALSS